MASHLRENDDRVWSLSNEQHLSLDWSLHTRSSILSYKIASKRLQKTDKKGINHILL